VRSKITTTIEEVLLNKAKTLAKQEGLEGANAIIERALELYFTSIQSEVWEKSLSSGWIKKLMLNGDSVLYENIKCRKTLENYKSEDYTQEALESKGWKKVCK
jgi:hypothetical protein